jgi:crossover junction endodeoxyribonuclease RuvC
MKEMKKEKAYIGIDPGKTGAAAIITTRHTGEEYIDIIDYLEPVLLAQEIKEWAETYKVVLAVVEKVHSMPKQGVTSSFNFGMNFGIWQGILSALQIPYSFVPPQAWQKGLFSKTDGDNKKRGLSVVRRLYPRSEFFKLEKHHNRADAMLIARYAKGCGDV